MRVLSRNVKGNNRIGKKRLEQVINAIARDSPDIVALQEVHVQQAEDFRAQLREVGLEHFFTTAKEWKKSYGNVIASKWKLRGATKWPTDAPYPQLLARARIETPDGPVKLYNAHIPNGSGNGWKKIDTFDSLYRALKRDAPKHPTIVVGDFNEPKEWKPGEPLVSFGQRKDGTTTGTWTRKPKHGPTVTRPREEWDQAVRHVLESPQLKHPLRSPRSKKPAPVTHRVGRKPRFFDHILVSEHFRVTKSGIHADWLTERWSDHAAVWAVLELR